MKTAELIGPALDWAVAKCEGDDVCVVVNCGVPEIWSVEDVHPFKGQSAYCNKDGSPKYYRNEKAVGLSGNPMPSYLDWAQGGPISHREKISIDYDADPECGGPCAASTRDAPCYWVGPTPLIAAMRCYVALKLGDEIEIPEELK